jgi:hypothetical protein
MFLEALGLGQTMRVKQFELFREDIRDLMNLTVAKMDNYLIAAWRSRGGVGSVGQSWRPESLLVLVPLK